MRSIYTFMDCLLMHFPVQTQEFSNFIERSNGEWFKFIKSLNCFLYRKYFSFLHLINVIDFELLQCVFKLNISLINDNASNLNIKL